VTARNQFFGMCGIRAWAAVAVALFALASAGPARALSLFPECAGDCYGLDSDDIRVDVTLNSVQLTMNFQTYGGSDTNPPGHPNLEGIAFKLFTNDDVNWNPESAWGRFGDKEFGPLEPTLAPFQFAEGVLSNNGCSDKGSGNGWDCFEATEELDIIGLINAVPPEDPVLELNFNISNAEALRGAGESSFKVDFGPQNGWLLSEALLPEPTGAALFLVGALVINSAMRRRRA
jgi:hypothetical protein